MAIGFAQPFVPKAKLFYNGRKKIFERLQQVFCKEERKVIWIHCASLGEFEQGRPIIENLKTKYPQFAILLTFFSPSGYEIRKNYNGADYIFYLPLDSKNNANKFLEIVKPTCALFVKYEYWYYYLTALKQRHIPTFIFSALFQERQIFFKWYGNIYRKMLHCFTHIFVQDEASQKLLNNIGISQVTIAGDTRFDRVKTILGENRVYPTVGQYKGNKKLIVAGSTWEKDDAILLSLMQQNNEYKLLLAPHEIGIEKAETLSKLFCSFNVFVWNNAQESIPEEANICIVNFIGHLAYLYRYADIVWIGGGFNKKGIHNTTEAAMYCKPIFFGPEYSRFREALTLVALKAAFSVSNADELSEYLQQKSDDKLKNAVKQMQQYVHTQLGAEDTIMQVLSAYLMNEK